MLLEIFISRASRTAKNITKRGKQIGASLGYNVASHQLSGFGSAGKSKTDSHYASVTEQAGIQAGKDGFDLTVGKETSLKGAVISSTAEKEKNQLTTGTLSWEDVENKANYKTGEKGIAYAPKTAGVALNARGLTPQIAPTVRIKQKIVQRRAYLMVQSQSRDQIIKSRTLLCSIGMLNKTFRR